MSAAAFRRAQTYFDLAPATRRTCSFPLSLYRLSKAYSWTTPVLVDEFDAGLLEGPLHDIKCRTARLAPLLFELVDSHDTNACAVSQALLTPAK
jgi:hypothetical protein